MRTYPECFGCVLQQAQSEMDLMGVDIDTQVDAVKKMFLILGEAEGSETPPYLSDQLHKILRDIPGYTDPYAEAKRNSHQIAMGYLEDLRNLIKRESDLLEQGLKVGAAGNIVDIINARDYHLWEEVESAVSQELLGGGLGTFRQKISEAPYLLYLADNVGETIFDRVFIETLDLPVIYGVKGGPILNDASLEDALAAGIDQVAEIVETGSNASGTLLDQCSDNFQNLFNESPLVLAKGQANFETLDNQGKKVFFLLRVKCKMISREIGYPCGSIVFKQGFSRS